ncbi:hypothetical protein LTR85_003108 [Meristemomyces frigidus]|nr:hypothetical protein LTR85_003108 [Meristemomyces frigidus]
MVSAASMVFAITELLEQILLEDSISMERLFILQRVSSRFRATIADSFYLQGKMRLRHLNEGEYGKRKSGSTKPMLTPFLRNNDLELRPFRTGAFEVQPTDRCRIAFHLDLGLASFASQNGTRLGLRGKKRFHDSNGSWGRMKVTMVPVAPVVTVSVSGKKMSYCETTVGQPGEGTLRELVWLLQAVNGRSAIILEDIADSYKWSSVRTPWRLLAEGGSDE